MKLIGIGFGSMIAAQRVLAIVEPDSAPIKRVVQEARERGISERTVRLARNSMKEKLESERRGKEWWLRLKAG